MSNRYVRIYEGQGSNIIGFSVGASDMPNTNEFQLFMANRGYTTTEVEPLAGSTSYRHVEIQPPMAEEHLRELGELCVRVVDSGMNETFVLDNRAEMPSGPYALAPVLARG